MIFSFGTEESVLQCHDKANNAVCLQYMVRVLHWEFAEGVSSGQYKTWTADYGLRTGYKIRTRYKTRTGKHGLGIKHGQGIKRGLRTGYKIRTTDYFGKNGANWF